MNLGADYIATGHYARVREVNGEFQLLKALDSEQDQSYFLHRLNQAQLRNTVPHSVKSIKTEVRKSLNKSIYRTPKKIQRNLLYRRTSFPQFLNRYLSYALANSHFRRRSDWATRRSELFTLGQRKGIGIGGVRSNRRDDGSSDARYVARTWM